MPVIRWRNSIVCAQRLGSDLKEQQLTDLMFCAFGPPLPSSLQCTAWPDQSHLNSVRVTEANCSACAPFPVCVGSRMFSGALPPTHLQIWSFIHSLPNSSFLTFLYFEFQVRHNLHCKCCLRPPTTFLPHTAPNFEHQIVPRKCNSQN